MGHERGDRKKRYLGSLIVEIWGKWRLEWDRERKYTSALDCSGLLVKCQVSSDS